MSLGTENRKPDNPIPPRDEVFEYIVFRGSDIEDLHVNECPKPGGNNPISNTPNDPAIVHVSIYMLYICGKCVWQFTVVCLKDHI